MHCGWSDGKFTQTDYLTYFNNHYENVVTIFIDLFKIKSKC
jgi:hypothetical protein